MNSIEENNLESSLLPNKPPQQGSQQSQQKSLNKNVIKVAYSKKFIALIVTLLSLSSFLLITTTSLVTLSLSKNPACNSSLTNPKHSSSSNNNNNAQVCQSDACFKSTKFMLEHINHTIEPCFNFYEFSCGNWIKNAGIETDQFSRAIEKSLKDLSRILAEPFSPHTDSAYVRNFKKYYSTCMNQTDIQLNGDLNFLKLMRAEFGNWPLLDTHQNQTSFSLEVNLAKLTILKTPLLLRFEMDSVNDHVYLMRTLVPENFCKMQLFYAELFKNPTNRNKFKVLLRTLRDFLLKLNLNEQSENVDDLIEEMLKLGEKIYLINDNKFQCGIQRKIEQFLLTPQNFDQYLNKNNNNNNNQSQFNFTKFIHFLNENTDFKLTNRAQILTSDFFMEYLKTVLHNFDLINDQKSFFNLIYFESLIHILSSVKLFSLPHIHTVFPMKYYQLFYDFELNSLLLFDHGTYENFKNMFLIDLELNCAHTVIDSFLSIGSNEMFELQRFYLSRTNNFRMIKKFALDLFRNLTETALDLINEQAWIEEHVKLFIKSKIGEMSVKMTYSDLFDSNSTLENESDLNLADDFLSNKFLIKKRMFRNEYRYLETYLKEAIPNRLMIFDIFQANMFFLQQFNTMLVPAIIFLEPIFSVDNPYYLSYATIGVYAAHELWHLVEEALQTSDRSKLVYSNYTSCLSDNYKKYVKVKYGRVIDGHRSAPDQAADYFGILVAFKTLAKILDDKLMSHLNLLIPGLNYDQFQLFFMRYSQGYCRRLDERRVQFENDHSIHDYRVFQPSVTHSFRKHFSCLEKQNEYSLNECKLFD